MGCRVETKPWPTLKEVGAPNPELQPQIFVDIGKIFCQIGTYVPVPSKSSNIVEYSTFPEITFIKDSHSEDPDPGPYFRITDPDSGSHLITAHQQY